MQRTIEQRAPLAADAATRAKDATDRIARIDRGETVAPFKPTSLADVLRAIGRTASDQRHSMRLAEIERLGGWDALIAEIAKRRRQNGGRVASWRGSGPRGEASNGSSEGSHRPFDD